MNTTETNKKFAEFLEWEVNEIEMIAPEQLRVSIPFEHSKGYFTTTIFKHHEAKFHNDWNWLMLVVDKTEATAQVGNESDNYIVSIKGNRCTIINMYGELQSTEGQTKIEAVYNACSMFVDWYNNQKP